MKDRAQSLHRLREISATGVQGRPVARAAFPSLASNHRAPSHSHRLLWKVSCQYPLSSLISEISNITVPYMSFLCHVVTAYEAGIIFFWRKGGIHLAETRNFVQIEYKQGTGIFQCLVYEATKRMSIARYATWRLMHTRETSCWSSSPDIEPLSSSALAILLRCLPLAQSIHKSHCANYRLMDQPGRKFLSTGLIHSSKQTYNDFFSISLA